MRHRPGALALPDRDLAEGVEDILGNGGAGNGAGAEARWSSAEERVQHTLRKCIADYAAKVRCFLWREVLRVGLRASMILIAGSHQKGIHTLVTACIASSQSDPVGCCCALACQCYQATGACSGNLRPCRRSTPQLYQGMCAFSQPNQNPIL